MATYVVTKILRICFLITHAPYKKYFSLSLKGCKLKLMLISFLIKDVIQGLMQKT